MRFFSKFLVFVLCFAASNAAAAMSISPETSIFKDVAIINFVKVSDIIAEELADNDIEDKVIIDIIGRKAGIKLKQKHDSYEVGVVDFSLNKRTRRFKTSLSFKSDDYEEIVDLRGRYDEIISVPVLSYRFPHGKVVTSSDIEYIDYEKSKTKHDTVQDANVIIGKELKRSVSAMRPVRMRDLVREQLITRNSVVSMVYKTPFVTLNTTGVSMEDGAKGDVIRVKNSDSNKIVEAEVKGSSFVVVSSEIL